MSYSRKIIQNGYTKKGEGSAIYLRIIIDRKKKLLPLKISWPAEYFDKSSGLVCSRHKDDPDVSDYNMIITDALARANEVFKYHRLTNTPLTINRFIKEYTTDLSKDDFLKYYSEKAKQRLKDGEIVKFTYDDHIATLRKLRKFSETLLFADIDEEWAFKFDSYLKRTIKSDAEDTINDRWKHHKNARTYLNQARKKDHIKMVYPYLYFRAPKKKGNWKPIYEEDIQKLWAFLENGSNRIALRKAVLRFLFMCYTSIRRGDIDLATTEWNKEGVLQYIQKKNKRFGRVTEIPLCDPAVKLWNMALELSEGKQFIFRFFAEQRSNEYLREVMGITGIKSKLHHHAGRHTFITLFLKNGGSIDMASKYAGHETIQQTMTYNHPDEERKRNEIKVMDTIGRGMAS